MEPQVKQRPGNHRAALEEKQLRAAERESYDRSPDLEPTPRHQPRSAVDGPVDTYSQEEVCNQEQRFAHYTQWCSAYEQRFSRPAIPAEYWGQNPLFDGDAEFVKSNGDYHMHGTIRGTSPVAATNTLQCPGSPTPHNDPQPPAALQNENHNGGGHDAMSCDRDRGTHGEPHRDGQFQEDAGRGGGQECHHQGLSARGNYGRNSRASGIRTRVDLVGKGTPWRWHPNCGSQQYAEQPALIEVLDVEGKKVPALLLTDAMISQICQALQSGADYRTYMQDSIKYKREAEKRAYTARGRLNRLSFEIDQYQDEMRHATDSNIENLRKQLDMLYADEELTKHNWEEAKNDMDKVRESRNSRLQSWHNNWTELEKPILNAFDTAGYQIQEPQSPEERSIPGEARAEHQWTPRAPEEDRIRHEWAVRHGKHGPSRRERTAKPPEELSKIKEYLLNKQKEIRDARCHYSRYKDDIKFRRQYWIEKEYGKNFGSELYLEERDDFLHVYIDNLQQHYKRQRELWGQYQEAVKVALHCGLESDYSFEKEDSLMSRYPATENYYAYEATDNVRVDQWRHDIAKYDGPETKTPYCMEKLPPSPPHPSENGFSEACNWSSIRVGECPFNSYVERWELEAQKQKRREKIPDWMKGLSDMYPGDRLSMQDAAADWEAGRKLRERHRFDLPSGQAESAACASPHVVDAKNDRAVIDRSVQVELQPSRNLEASQENIAETEHSHLRSPPHTTTSEQLSPVLDHGHQMLGIENPIRGCNQQGPPASMNSLSKEDHSSGQADDLSSELSSPAPSGHVHHLHNALQEPQAKINGTKDTQSSPQGDVPSSEPISALPRQIIIVTCGLVGGTNSRLGKPKASLNRHRPQPESQNLQRRKFLSRMPRHLTRMEVWMRLCRMIERAIRARMQLRRVPKLAASTEDPRQTYQAETKASQKRKTIG